MPPIRRVVDCPKDNTEKEVEDCESCEHYDGDDTMEVTCTFEDDNDGT
jgi:hypothetical protein